MKECVLLQPAMARTEDGVLEPTFGLPKTRDPERNQAEGLYLFVGHGTLKGALGRDAPKP